ncbi:MAG: alpha-2-macroglobulin family protein, partial [Litorimonas sp.]
DGKAKHEFKIAPQSIIYGRISVESAVRDDRGKYITSNSAADFVGVTRLVGLKQTKWVYEQGEEEKFEYLVVDKNGKLASGTPVDIKIEYEQVKSAKVKGAGNAYITKYTNTWVDSGNCKAKSKKEPGICTFTPELPGRYRMIARIKDTKGVSHSTKTHAWVVGKGRVVWEQPNDNSLQIIPEQTEFEIGDRARYLIKNPYPGAKALITLERYGVLKSWVQTLDGSTPVIEFDIEKDFMPGIYLSITLMSPRVDAPLPKFGEVDLGKPSFKTGYVSIPVNDPYKQMDVSVDINGEVYKPRDTVTVKLSAAPRVKDSSEKIEIAVAVLDEAVLDLIQGGTNYFDPYKGFNSLDGLDLRNFSLLTQLVGRQKIEKKGANAGGDGGADISMRTLFKYVSYWNPSIIPDENGQASISFEIPDNLTGWRVLAFAVTPTDRMGLGHNNFKVNRPTEVRPLMPNQVTEGDSFMAGFSVMNRTDKTREINVELTASGPLKTGGKLSKTCNEAVSLTPAICSYKKTIKLGPYKRETIYMPLSAAALPQNRETPFGTISFKARANDALDGDGITHSLKVSKRRSLDTAANYASTTEASGSENLSFPSDIHPDIGEVSVVLSPSVIGNVDGAFRYIKDYDYAGWEAKLSRGVMADHHQNLISYMPEDFSWEGSETLALSTLNEANNYQAPNGGMVYFRPRNSHVSPYLSAYTALSFNWLRESGHDVPTPVEEKLHGYLDRMLKQDIAPTFYTRGMSSTVRAVALAALAPHGKVSAADLQRYRKDVKYMDLMGKAHYLQAALQVEGSQDIIAEVTDMILASSVQSGGKFSFNETYDDSYSRILATPLRANCSILSSFTAYAKTETGKAAVADVPFKLSRMITQARGNRDHWPNTQENVFCMNALVDYARSYEAVEPNLTAKVSIDDNVIGSSNFTSVSDAPVTHSRLISAEDVGASRKVTVSKTGEGRLYYATRMSYAPLDIAATRQNAGMDIRKEYNVERNNKWALLDNPS